MSHFRPMHLSDNLAKLAQLIDFGKSEKDDEDQIKTEPEASPTKQDSKAKQTADNKQAKPWPWEWLRSSLV